MIMQGPLKRAEVYEFAPVIFWSSLLVAFVVQGLLPVRFPFGHFFDLPLLFLIYFAGNRKNKALGTFLGAGIGLIQDALSDGYLGVFGMSKSVVGYMSAAVAIQFNMKRLLSRVVATGGLVGVHRLVLWLLEQTLLEGPGRVVALDFLNSIMVNTALSIGLYPMLNRLRKRAGGGE